MPHSFSLLRYPGGKARLGPYLASVADAHGMCDFAYCEPFAGSAGAALYLLFTGHASRLILSDKDPIVARFWHLVLRHADIVANFIEQVELSIDEWHRQRAVYLDVEAAADQRALAFFYLNRTNRSGLVMSGPVGGRRQTGPYLLDARFRRAGLLARLRRIALMRDLIEFTERDVFKSIACLKRRRCFQEGAVWAYFDPPYHGWGDDLYQCKFSRSEHRRLSRVLRAETRLPWVLSYDDVPDVRATYCNLDPTVLTVSYFIHTAKTANELVLSNICARRSRSDATVSPRVALNTDLEGADARTGTAGLARACG